MLRFVNICHADKIKRRDKRACVRACARTRIKDKRFLLIDRGKRTKKFMHKVSVSRNLSLL